MVHLHVQVLSPLPSKNPRGAHTLVCPLELEVINSESTALQHKLCTLRGMPGAGRKLKGEFLDTRLQALGLIARLSFQPVGAHCIVPHGEVRLHLRRRHASESERCLD